jgi:uncharacterized protein (TIGR02444 family)
MTIAQDPAFPEHPFWDFSLQTYRGEVPGACLRLQDSYGLDANVVLYALWRGTQTGVPLTTAGMEEFLQAVRQWHGSVVQPLRQSRRASRITPQALPEALVKTLHDRILQVEIATEHAEQLLIADSGDRYFGPTGEATEDADGGRQAATHNLQAYFAATDTPLDETVLAVVQTLLDAVFGLHKEMVMGSPAT